jgi:hypothetical protein
MVEIYHAHTDEDTKLRIMSKLSSEDSTIRVLIATVTCGMGVNITDISIVIIWGDESIPSNKKCFKQLIHWQCSFSRVTADLKYSRSLHLQWYFLSLRHCSHGIETLFAYLSVQ